MTLRIGSLCSGYGGLDMAVQRVFGGDLAWVADPDPGAAAILKHHHPDVPNLGDITKTNWEDVTRVDLLCGGYPCQPFSDAGLRKGIEDERHLWPHFIPAIRVLRPRYIVLENVRGHLRRGFNVVLADLAALGFDAEWQLVRASEVGAPHRRERLIVLATAQDTDSTARGERRFAAPRQTAGGRAWTDASRRGGAPAADADGAPGRLDLTGSGSCPVQRTAVIERAPEQPRRLHRSCRDETPVAPETDWGIFEPAIRRWEHSLGRPAPRPTEPGRTSDRLAPLFVEWLMGLPAGHVTDVPGLSRNAQLKALGNGVVPQQADAGLNILLGRRAAA